MASQQWWTKFLSSLYKNTDTTDQNITPVQEELLNFYSSESIEVFAVEDT